MSLVKKRKQAGIPPIPKDATPEQRQFFQAIRENLAVRMGQEGDPLEKAVTFKDMARAGMLEWSGGGVGTPTAPGVLPPSTEFDYSPPPAPTNLVANGGFGIVFLTWDNPNLNYNYYTEVWRSPVDALDLTSVDMKLVGSANATLYVDNVGGDRTVYYYWVRFVKAIGTQLIYGPFNGTAGTEGQTSLDPAYVIELLEGQLRESELALELLTPIQAIPGIQTTLGDHGSRIATTEAALADMLNIPAYDTATSYVIDDMVTYGGFTWRALVNMAAPAPAPVEGASWTKVGQYTTFSDIIAANSLAIDDLDTRITTAEGTLTSYGTSITALQNRVTDTESGVSGNSQAIGTLDSRVTVTEQGISANSSDITLLQNGLSTAEGGITANSTALNLLDSRVTTAEGTITAHGQDITQLQTDLQLLDADGSAAAIQDLGTRVTANEQSITATATDVTTLQSSVNNVTAAVQTKAEASVVSDLEGEVTTVKARYSIKLDANGRMSGLIFGDNGTASSLVIASNSMFFVDPGQSITPFNPQTDYTSMEALRDTQLVFGYAKVEGLNRFVINAPAYIPEGYITTAMVKNATINQAQIVDLAVAAADIDIANIWQLTIGGEIRSGNFVSGSTGWRITQGGNVELSNAVVRGHIEATTGHISDAVSIGGLGALAYKNSVFYSDVAGDKPEAAERWEYTMPNDSNRFITLATNPGNRALATFRVWDTTGGRHNSLEFTIGCSYNAAGNATFALLGASRYSTKVFDRIRLYTGATYDPMYVTLYCTNVVAGQKIFVEMVGNIQTDGWKKYTSVSNPSFSGKSARDWFVDPGLVSAPNNWVRPNSTLIDGNKIFTGDAYVDTLQIKGQAVTVMVARTNGSVNVIQTTRNMHSFTYNHGEAFSIPVFIQAGAIGAAFGTSVTLQLLIDGVMVGYGGVGPSRATVSLNKTRNLGPGSHSIVLRAAGSGEFEEGFVALVGTKR